MKGVNHKIVFFHIGYWILIVLLLTFIWGTYDGNFYRNFFVQLWSLPARLFLSYLTLGLLIPHFFSKGKLTTFSGLFILLLILSVLLVQRPIIIYHVEGTYLPYNSEEYFNLIALVNTGIDVAMGVIPLLFFHHNMKQKGKSEMVQEVATGPTPYLILKEGHTKRKVPCSSILFIESQKNKLITETSDGAITTYGNMSSIVEKLPEEMFLRIHRSFIINVTKVDHYSARSISIGEKEFPIGRHYKEHVTASLNARFGQ